MLMNRMLQWREQTPCGGPHTGCARAVAGAHRAYGVCGVFSIVALIVAWEGCAKRAVTPFVLPSLSLGDRAHLGRPMSADSPSTPGLTVYRACRF